MLHIKKLVPLCALKPLYLNFPRFSESDPWESGTRAQAQKLKDMNIACTSFKVLAETGNLLI